MGFEDGKREYSQRTMQTSKKQAMMMILLSLVWAVAFISSAIIFKGSPIKESIQAALYVVGMSFWLWPVLFTARPLC
jgi:membrane protein YdbS with pleckstrin-like domain